MNSNEDRGGTQYFRIVNQPENSVASVLADVYRSLQKKGYNPVNQLVGYIMSEDPTYITSHKGARSLIMRAERDEIIEVLLEDYIQNNFK